MQIPGEKNAVIKLFYLKCDIYAVGHQTGLLGGQSASGGAAQTGQVAEGIERLHELQLRAGERPQRSEPRGVADRIEDIASGIRNQAILAFEPQVG